MTDTQKLLDIMVSLRDPAGGCPWDREQTFSTIAPYTIEEAYEVADAIERGDLAALRGELGDLLFQVVYHAQLASEQDAFDFDDVVAGICEKLIRRHPHVFGDEQIVDARAQTRAWEQHKAAERAANAISGSVLDDVPRTLPALRRALKLGARAAGLGFDWPDMRGVRAKIEEELEELEQALEQGGDGSRERLEDELGDVLFALTNLARHLHLDPETALRRANAKFERRFHHVEGNMPATPPGTLPELEALERLWQQAKDLESQSD